LILDGAHSKVRLLSIHRLFNLTSYEKFRDLLEGAQEIAGTEIISLAALPGAGVICGVFEGASSRSFPF
jgi:hypothetical protein